MTKRKYDDDMQNGDDFQLAISDSDEPQPSTSGLGNFAKIPKDDVCVITFKKSKITGNIEMIRNSESPTPCTNWPRAVMEFLEQQFRNGRGEINGHSSPQREEKIPRLTNGREENRGNNSNRVESASNVTPSSSQSSNVLCRQGPEIENSDVLPVEGPQMLEIDLTDEPDEPENVPENDGPSRASDGASRNSTSDANSDTNGQSASAPTPQPSTSKAMPQKAPKEGPLLNSTNEPSEPEIVPENDGPLRASGDTSRHSTGDANSETNGESASAPTPQPSTSGAASQNAPKAGSLTPKIRVRQTTVRRTQKKTITLDSDPKDLFGVTKKNNERLKENGINTVGDLVKLRDRNKRDFENVLRRYGFSSETAFSCVSDLSRHRFRSKKDCSNSDVRSPASESNTEAESEAPPQAPTEEQNPVKIKKEVTLASNLTELSNIDNEAAVRLRNIYQISTIRALQERRRSFQTTRDFINWLMEVLELHASEAEACFKHLDKIND